MSAEIRAPRFIARDLYDLSGVLGRLNPSQQVHGLLGGSWGYGQDFENGVFVMFPFWWGDCECGHNERKWQWADENEHAGDCDPARCTCDHRTRWEIWSAENDHDASCPLVRPNFLHKATGFSIRWYKYIGRSMTVNHEISFDEWREIYNECRDSLYRSSLRADQ